MLSHLPDAVAEGVGVGITQYAYIDTKPSLPLDTITEIKPPDPEQEVKQEIKQEEVKPAAPADERIRVVEGFGHKTYYISGIPVHFPFQPYPSQLGMMSHMIRALNGAQNTMVESPTGSGKSLALLCAVLAWRRSFEAKCRQTKANVQQTIRRYSEHNSMGFAKMLYDVKYGNSGTDQTALPAVEHAKPVDSIALRYDDDPGYSSSDLFADDLYQIIPDAKPLLWIEPTESDSDDDPANALPTPSTYTAPPSALVASHEDLLKLALSLLPETAQFILDQSEEAPPAGLDSADIDEMRDYIQTSAPVNGMPKIYFGTRTHKQVSQLVDELRRKTPYRLRSAVLGSRAQTCINKRARKAQSIDDKCRQLVDDNWCGPHRAYRKLMMHEKLQPMGELELWDLEDIGKLGKQTSACPYFAARELSTEADLIFCPYQYILDPGVRSSVGIDLKGNIVILDEAHNVENAARDSGSWEITDEHLNVIAMECRKLAQRGTLVAQHSTVETLATTLINWLQGSSHPYEYLEFDSQTAVWPNSDESLDALLERITLSPDLVAKLAMAVSTIEAHIKIIRQNREKRKPWDDEDYDSYPPEMDDIVEEDSRHLSTGSMRLLEQLLRVLGHLAPNSPFRQDYRVACIRKSNSQTLAAESVATAGPKHAPRKKLKTSPLSDSPPPPNCINALAFWALNPGVVFSEIAAKARSIILTSGTLSPLDSYASELQVQFSSTLEASHVIDPQRFRAVTVECGPSGALLDAKYKNVDLFSFQDDVGSAIASIAARSPDGMLVFVPSYSLLAKLLARWRATECLSEIEVHKRVFVEPQGGSKEDFDRLLSNYRNCLAKNRPPGRQPARRGAIMFAVYRGKVSEGIDFSDYFCRTVVNIGIPYPAFKDVKVILKREYNDARSNPKHTPPDQGLLLTGSKWYDIQAFRAINQALGRCLRHKMDWGVIFMLESRFAQPWNVERLSKWVRKHMHFYHTFEEAKLDLDAFYTARIQEDIDGDVNSILPACSSLGLESPTTPTTPTAHSVDFILN
ncbi:hypothetical protein GGF42_005471 [Coemansia sp. RSA 2424]|nr:hypothetical protein GGF42_005471 [Coemansia sp. RSA 2424]